MAQAGEVGSLSRNAMAYVLAGHHVYKMDHELMLADHGARRADVTIGRLEVPRAKASA